MKLNMRKLLFFNVLFLFTDLVALSQNRNTESFIRIFHCQTDSSAYASGSKVFLTLAFSIGQKDIGNIHELSVAIRRISKPDCPLVHYDILTKKLSPNHEQKIRITDRLIWTIPKGTPEGVYGVYIEFNSPKDGRKIEYYKTFFRIIDKLKLTVFDIKRSNYKGIDIFQLNGGMSAEFVVEKSLESLASGISHTWEVHRAGDGPNPVYSTPDFLKLSIDKTVSLYDEVLGNNDGRGRQPFRKAGPITRSVCWSAQGGVDGGLPAAVAQRSKRRRERSGLPACAAQRRGQRPACP